MAAPSSLRCRRTRTTGTSSDARGYFRQTWSSFLEEAELVALDAVGTPSGAKVAVLYADSLRVFDALSKVELLNFATATSTNTDVALGDLDLDGVLDAVVCDDEILYLFELANGTQTDLRYGFGCSDVAIGQMDADPQLEIVIAGNPAGGYVLDGVTLAVEWGDLEGFGPQIALGDLDGDGRDEILASTDFDTAARALDPETNSELWRLEGSYYPPSLFVADLDPAPGIEAIVHERYAGLSILVGATGELIRAPVIQTSAVSRLAAADTDGDGDLELLWGSGDCCYGDGVLWALEGGSNVVQEVSENTHSLEGAFAVGEFGDSLVKEVAIAVTSNESYQAQAQIVVLDMSQGRQARRSSFDEATVSGNVSAMIGMRLDGDAASEICLASDNAPGPVRCVDGQTFEEEWAGGSLGYVEALAAAELDGDPAPEILAGTSGPAIEAREGDSGWLKWRTPEIDPNADAVDRLLALDVDGDGLDEVIGRLASYYSGAGTLALFSGATGDLLSGPWNLNVWAMAKPALVENPANRVYVALSDSTIRGLDPADRHHNGTARDSPRRLAPARGRRSRPRRNARFRRRRPVHASPSRRRRDRHGRLGGTVPGPGRIQLGGSVARGRRPRRQRRTRFRRGLAIRPVLLRRTCLRAVRRRLRVRRHLRLERHSPVMGLAPARRSAPDRASPLPRAFPVPQLASLPTRRRAVLTLRRAAFDPPASCQATTRLAS